MAKKINEGEQTITESIWTKISRVSVALRAPKNQRNNFGKYNYRNVEDILEAAKPLLAENGLALILTDEVVEKAGRVYLVATARVIDESGNHIEVNGWAREGETKSGMDVAQITGACCSYARKYALCGLFCISGGADFDAMDNTKEGQPKKATEAEIEDVRYELETLTTTDGLANYWKSLRPEVREACKEDFTRRKIEITGVTFTQTQ